MTKTYRIKPDLRVLYPWVLLCLGLLMSSINQMSNLLWFSFGFSVLILWIFYRRLRLENYILADHSIQVETFNSDQTITLLDITAVRATRVWWLAAFNLGQIELVTPSLTVRLRGIKDPEGIGVIIQKAVDAAIELRNRQHFKTEAPKELHPAGTLESLNDLVGLWQQGLIDDDTFKAEQGRLKKTN